MASNDQSFINRLLFVVTVFWELKMVSETSISKCFVKYPDKTFYAVENTDCIDSENPTNALIYLLWEFSIVNNPGEQKYWFQFFIENAKGEDLSSHNSLYIKGYPVGYITENVGEARFCPHRSLDNYTLTWKIFLNGSIYCNHSVVLRILDQSTISLVSPTTNMMTSQDSITTSTKIESSIAKVETNSPHEFSSQPTESPTGINDSPTSSNESPTSINVSPMSSNKFPTSITKSSTSIKELSTSITGSPTPSDEASNTKDIIISVSSVVGIIIAFIVIVVVLLIIFVIYKKKKTSQQRKLQKKKTSQQSQATVALEHKTTETTFEFLNGNSNLDNGKGDAITLGEPKPLREPITVAVQATAGSQSNLSGPHQPLDVQTGNENMVVMSGKSMSSPASMRSALSKGPDKPPVEVSDKAPVIATETDKDQSVPGLTSKDATRRSMGQRSFARNGLEDDHDEKKDPGMKMPPMTRQIDDQKSINLMAATPC